MQTKLDKLKAAWTAGDTAWALRIAARFPELGEHGPAIKRAHECLNGSGSRFYQQIGRDPAAIVAAGLAALAARYRLPPTA